MNFISGILNAASQFFKNIFGGNIDTKAAYTAGVFVASNNQEKVKRLMPTAKQLLESAKAGSIGTIAWQAFFDDVMDEIKDPNLKTAISIFITSPGEIVIGRVNPKAVELLEAFIDGASGR